MVATISWPVTGSVSRRWRDGDWARERTCCTPGYHAWEAQADDGSRVAAAMRNIPMCVLQQLKRGVALTWLAEHDTLIRGRLGQEEFIDLLNVFFLGKTCT
jgi:hypothetical protein